MTPRRKDSPSPLAEDAQNPELPEADVQAIEAFTARVDRAADDLERRVDAVATDLHAIEGDDVAELTPNPRYVEMTRLQPMVNPEPSLERSPTNHLLDIAPVHSKIVVVRDNGVLKPMLATPERVIELPLSDPARRLPEGAVIRKVAEGEFASHQLSPAYDYPPRVTKTTAEAISGFVPYFHRS